MVIGTLLLVSLSSQCFSLKDKSEVEILYNSSETTFEKWWTTPNNCNTRWRAESSGALYVLILVQKKIALWYLDLLI